MHRRALLSTMIAFPWLAGCVRPMSTQSVARPIVIAHRGASGERPEHTLAAYERAIEQGADFIEPDLVTTRDGVLIARHENELSGSTDVAERAVFRDRQTEKEIDGRRVRGWFAEDFSLDEIKSLRCRETQPELRPANRRYDGQYAIPTLAEVVTLARRHGVGIYPETKHPTYFERLGRRLDGTPIAFPITVRLLDELRALDFTDPARVFLQSFELGNLREAAQVLMPARGLAIPLVWLLGDLDPNAAAGGFAAPYDLVALGALWRDHWPELARHLAGADVPNYGRLASTAVLSELRAIGIAGLGPWKEALLLRQPLSPPRDADGDGRAELPWRRTGGVHPLLAQAKALGFVVHPYTLRAEERYLAEPEDGSAPSMEWEMQRLLALGVDGWFTDYPGRGVAVRDAFRAARS